jgi:hypothetical protein
MGDAIIQAEFLDCRLCDLLASIGHKHLHMVFQSCSSDVPVAFQWYAYGVTTVLQPCNKSVTTL